MLISSIFQKSELMAGEDLYAILGVLPDAEEVVIAAAYRALAQRYHPDRWNGDAMEAHRRMSAINQAYSVLRDKALRSGYDRARAQSQQAQFTADDKDIQAEAFESALSELEGRWKIACSIYPDLKEYRSTLTKISTSLAFAFVTAMLETKSFVRRSEIASHLERMFLERYFGTNKQILKFARSLILAGQKAPAKALNRLVDVMGSDVDAHLLIERVENDFGFSEARERANRAIENLSATSGASNFLGLVRRGDLQGVATMLMENPLYVSVTDGIGRTPLHLAAAEKNVRMANLLIDAGAPFDRLNCYGLSAVRFLEDNKMSEPLARIRTLQGRSKA